MIEPKRITFEKAREVLFGFFDSILAKDLSNERDVGSAVKNDALGGFGQVEFACKRLAKSLYARAAGADQGAIDVEENQPNHPTITAGQFAPVKRRSAIPSGVNPVALRMKLAAEPLSMKRGRDRMENVASMKAILSVARMTPGLVAMDQIEYAILERNGDISIIPKGEK